MAGFARAIKMGLLFLVICVTANSDGVKAETSFSQSEDKKVDLPSSSLTQESWFSSDKLAHLTFSLFISGMCYKIYHDNYYHDKNSSLAFSAGFTLSLGLGKEFYDKRRPKNKFSYKDLIADILGTSLGLILSSNY